MTSDPNTPETSFGRVAAVLDELAELPPAEWEAYCAQHLQSEQERAQVLRLANEEFREPETSGVPGTEPLPDSSASPGGSAARAFPQLVQGLGDDESENRPLPSYIGPFRVTGRLGRGGMGEVFLAVREGEGFEQTVAVKRIRERADDPLAEERFRREREVLAGLEHPGIARLVDGGKDQAGALYYAMEYVEGDAITRVCDELRLTLEERVAVFAQVCDAVAAAHRHLVLHRDLKPANILMTVDRQVKLVDFGIAKPLPLSDVSDERTGLRGFTPEYAAPEQRLGRSTTTATDVYGLGLVLYELIVGVGLHRASASDARTLEEALLREVTTARSAWANVEREIGHSEIERLADSRRSDLASIERVMRGDLGNILRMALRPEPSERYASAEALREDLQNYLQHRPVVATRGNFWYQARKLARRHRATTAVASVAAVLVAAGVWGTWSQSERARDERDRALQAESQARGVNEFLLQDLLGAFAPETLQSSEVTVAELTDLAAEQLQLRFAETPELRRTVQLRLAELYLDQGNPRSALEQIEAASELPRADSEFAWRVPVLEARWGILSGEYEQALSSLEEILAQHAAALEAEPAELARVHLWLTDALRRDGQYTAAEQRLRALIELWEASQVRAYAMPLLRAKSQLVDSLSEQRRAPEALAIAEKLYEAQKKELGVGHPDTLNTANRLTFSYGRVERKEQAVEHGRETLEIARSALGEDHPITIDAWNVFGRALTEIGLAEEAIEAYGQVAELSASRFGAGHHRAITGRMNQGVVYARKGQPEMAEQLYRESIDGYRAALGEQHPNTIRAIRNLSGLLRGVGRKQEADQLVEELIRIGRSVAASEDPDPLVLAAFAQNLGRNYPAQYRNLEEALGYARQANEAAAGRSYEVLVTLARLQLEAKETAAGLASLERALEMPEALYTYSMEREWVDIAVDLAQVERAEAALRSIHQRRREVRSALDPIHGTSHRQLSELYRRTGRIEAAVEEASAALEFYRRCCPGDTREVGLGHQQIGRVLLDLARFDEARTHLEEANRLFEIASSASSRDRRAVTADLERLQELRAGG